MHIDGNLPQLGVGGIGGNQKLTMSLKTCYLHYWNINPCAYRTGREKKFSLITEPYEHILCKHGTLRYMDWIPEDSLPD
jgi:hypothetical protein